MVNALYRPRGIKEASEILSLSSNFLAYYDPDIDGLIAGYLTQRFLRLFGIDSAYYINSDRAHGFKMGESQLHNLKGYTVIAVDFSMSREQLVYLTDLGINVINIDHHNIEEKELVHVISEKTGCRGVIINNQYCFEPAEYRFLSGAGVVYYVMGAFYPEFCKADEKALVGMSLLSDIRPIENVVAKDFLDYTYNTKSPLLEYLVAVTKNASDFGFGIQTLDRNYIDYTFSPKINALFRLNKGDEAVNIINGCYPLENGLNVYKNIQVTSIETIIKNLQGEELPNLVSKFVTADLKVFQDFNASNFIGVACSRIKNFGKTSFLFVREGDMVLRGSVRGLCDDVDYLTLFRKHGFTGEGHKNAFGVMNTDISKINLDALDTEICELEKNSKKTTYDGRVIEVTNLSMYLKGKNLEIAELNNYVRDAKRTYLKYVGSGAKRYPKGKMWEYTIDGVTVKCFDEDLNLENGLILPLLERNSYVQFYLRKQL